MILIVMMTVGCKTVNIYVEAQGDVDIENSVSGSEIDDALDATLKYFKKNIKTTRHIIF